MTEILKPTYEPLRAVITGIDGAGKSTTASQVVYQLNEYRIAKPGPGRPFYTVVNGEKKYYYKGFIKLIDHLHTIADHSHNPEFVGAVNAINVILNAKIIEPDLVHKANAQLVLGARDFYIDPAVYSIIYSTKLGNKTMSERFDTLKSLINAPYRDVVFFLTIPPDKAIERIEHRIATERKNPQATEREKWRHMHEEPISLQKLQLEYFSALEEIRKRHPVQIYQMDTTDFPQRQVVSFITQILLGHLEQKNSEKGKWQIINGLQIFQIPFCINSRVTI